ncbi:putative RNA polymerase II subunit B1 CTD phosphatase RPAP2 [Acropora millepora]|uniref:putative RNA polymerase II subunit B1 CTD phosphatase RPAP2 n=1 Tax=Acropora millepora TaxID=45264 RepID=UPI001CF2D91E|nr:putative RNA polymerase II subunit B1 CTD phosphatase RPAP2 [Acropora millepora]
MAEEMSSGMADNTTKPKKQSRRKQGTERRGKTAGSTKEKIDEQRRLKELEASIRSQVAAEERAHKIVEKLVLEDNISSDFLIQAGNFIATSHYADVVEERMIAKKCGYPLCNNQLNQIPTQRYTISLKTNRVYDITERKRFCSNFCFKASKYFESQISDSPVWTRIGESLRTFLLLENEDGSSRPGSGVVLLGGEDEQFSRNDLKGDSHSITGENSDKEHGNDREENFTENTVHQCRQEESKTNSQEKERSTTSESCDFDHKDVPTSNLLSLSLSSSSLSSSSSSSSSSSKTQEKPDYKTEKAQVTLKLQRNECTKDLIVQSVRKVLQEWCTQSTLQFFGFSVQTDARSSFSVQDSFAARVAQFLHPAVSAEADSDSDSDQETRPIISEDGIVIKERKTQEKNVVCILPPIDSKSQSTIRRRIVLEKLFKTLGRKNELLSRAVELNSSEFDALLYRLAISRQDVDLVLSPLTSNDGPQDSMQSQDSLSFNSNKSAGKTDKEGVKERENFGDMEELD